MDEITSKRGDELKVNRDFSFLSLMKFVFPSIFTFLFIAAYQTVDGIFIELFVGDLAIAAVNLFYPVLSLLVAVGIMLGTGANAMTLRYIGEGNKKRADSVFSQTVIVAVIISVVSSIALLVFAEPIMRFLGASDLNIGYLRPYYFVLSAGAIMIVIQSALGVFVIGEGKSTLTAVLIVVGGVLNCVLDFVFMKFLEMGIMGAAVATLIGYSSSVIYALWFYSSKKKHAKGKSIYDFGFTKIRPRDIFTVCSNGSSDLVSNLSGGITALFMNRIIMSFCGEIGVSALSVVLYFQFFIVAVFMGFSMAVEPIFSYHYGKGDVYVRRRIFKLSVGWVALLSVLLGAVMWLFRGQVVGLFFKPGTDIFALTLKGLEFAIPACLFCGFNTFASSLFTAFGNGLVSALLSVSRTLVILSALVFFLSAVFGENGLWAAWTITEFVSFFISVFVVIKYKNRYGYLNSKNKPV